VEQETQAQHLKYYARLYVVRGGLEGGWKLPTDRRVQLHLGKAATTTGGGVASSFIDGNATTTGGGAPGVSRDDYLVAEKIINLDNSLFLKDLPHTIGSRAANFK
jgi:hypothetical protein